MTGFRAATATDAPEIARILRAARDQAMPWLPRVHTPDEDLWFVRHRVLASSDVRIAGDGQTLSGFIARRDDWVDHLYVDPACWGGGIGSALLTRAMTGTDSLQLWVFKRNVDARRFYARHGFVPVEETDGSGNEENEPDIRLVWRRP